MKLWKTKEKRDSHTVKICIPTHTMDHINRGLDSLRTVHQVSDFAHITLVSGWNLWIKATWTNDH